MNNQMGPSLNSNYASSDSSDENKDAENENGPQNADDEAINIKVNEMYDSFDVKLPLNVLNNDYTVLWALVNGLRSSDKNVCYKALFLLLQIISSCNNDNNVIKAVIDAGFAISVADFLNDENKFVKHTSIKLIEKISENKDEGVQWLIDPNFIPKILQLYSSTDIFVLTCTINIVQNITVNINVNHQYWIDCDLVSYIKILFSFPDDGIRICALRTINDCLSEYENYQKVIIDAGILSSILQLLSCSSSKYFGMAVEDVTDLIQKCNSDHIMYLLDSDIIHLLNDALENRETPIIYMTILSFQKLLTTASNRTVDICKKIKKCGGLDKIGRLQDHSNRNISMVANDIIATYFSSEYHEDSDIFVPENDDDESFGKGVRLYTRMYLRQHERGQRRWRNFQYRYRWLS